jgi:hypothetical protein
MTSCRFNIVLAQHYIDNNSCVCKYIIICTSTGSKEAGEGGREVRRWPGKPESNISNLDQTRSKTRKVTRAKEKVKTT